MRATIGGATIEGATIIPGTYNSYSFHIKSLPSDKNSYFICFFFYKIYWLIKTKRQSQFFEIKSKSWRKFKILLKFIKSAETGIKTAL